MSVLDYHSIKHYSVFVNQSIIIKIMHTILRSLSKIRTSVNICWCSRWISRNNWQIKEIKWFGIDVGQIFLKISLTDFPIGVSYKFILRPQDYCKQLWFQVFSKVWSKSISRYRVFYFQRTVLFAAQFCDEVDHSLGCAFRKSVYINQGDFLIENGF